MFITQISVYLENNHGTFRSLTKTLAEKNIDMLAVSVADTAHFGIVRIVVRESDIEPAVLALRENGFVAKTNRVHCVAVPNRPAGLDDLLSIIEANGISIEYMYSLNYIIGNKAMIVLRLSKEGMEKTQIDELLLKENVMMVSQEDINRL